MTDEKNWEERRGEGTSGSLGGQGVDTDEEKQQDDALGLGNARPGAGSNWQPGPAGTTETSGSSGTSTSGAGTTSMGGGSSSMGGTTSSMGSGGSSSGGRVSTATTGDPVMGGQDTETRSGSWGNRSGSGSGGEGERELDDESGSEGAVSDDITGSAGTNG